MSDAQRAALALLVTESASARVHPRIGDNRPLWVTWPDGAARVMPDGTVARGDVQRDARGAEHDDGWEPCYRCAYLRRPVGYGDEHFHAERDRRAGECVTCGGLGILGPGPAMSKRAPRHDIERGAWPAEAWLAAHPGTVATAEAPARYPVTREQVRATYEQARRERSTQREARVLAAERLGVSPRKVKRDCAHGHRAAHGWESPELAELRER